MSLGMINRCLGVALLAVLPAAGPAAAEPPADCAHPEKARAHLARLALAELEYAEDVHREGHWNALGRCADRPDALACRAAATRRFDARWREQRDAIEARYRRALEDYTARCWTSIT